MSELKAISGHEIREDIDYKEWFKYGKELCDTLYYHKSEADKVIADLEESHKMEVEQLLMEIAELKAQKAQAEDDCAYWKMKTAEVDKAIRHANYKRCLAMALWCSAEIGVLEFFCGPRIKYYKRWQKRWFKIAEKFKDKEAK